ncbi:NAD(P)/FAD-dependent oxidoreductase [Bradyrhizobium canariense]|uniref:NADPH-dependent 2,4-dienoyl-CoA reductase, sulfur reductase n=1 Tax=Bradyrhizobium canariense TaxID=255045 RepID=A0A1H2BHK9_9BRAD|nr:FAD-dependent oxidoreductase [Bradyrhizobium canariense]SDT57266.1 NADPH-dependent 2,4-dienoyl-CoA reductase, sulfur reductase [Bradyrhizobium canariense]
MSGLVIIGASYAGVQAGISAREKGYQAPIRIVADETHLPYQRPPLSKGFLSGSVAHSNLILRGDDYFKARGIELVLGHRAVSLDRDAGRVELQGGDPFAFDQLLIATGSRARQLTVPGHARDGIVYLRTLDDAVNLKPRLEAANEIVIIGGGFIGLEVAATAAKAGKKVVLIEAASRLLERAVSPLISQFLLNIHLAHGVDIRFNQSVVGIEGTSAVHDVICSDAARVRGDLVVAGIGGIANDELASAAGIGCANGVDVDEFGRTGVPNIFAAGDCSNHHSIFAGRRVRLESVQNATDQGNAAGAAIAGKPEPYVSVPRFWSDQYDVKLQIVGLSAPNDTAVIRGAIDDGRFSVFYYRGPKLMAVDSINRPGDQMIARRLIAASLSPTPEQAADGSFDLKKMEAVG